MPPLTGRQPPTLSERQTDALFARRHPLDERDLFACDGLPEIRQLGRLALRLTDDTDRMNTYFAIGDLCAGRTEGIDGRLLIFYVGKTLNAYLRAHGDAPDSVNRRVAERAREQYVSWVIEHACEVPSGHNISAALWAFAEWRDTTDDPNTEPFADNVAQLLRLFSYRAARPKTGSLQDTLGDPDETHVGSRLVDSIEVPPGRPIPQAVSDDVTGDTMDGTDSADFDPLQSLDGAAPPTIPPPSRDASWPGVQPPQQTGQRIERLLHSLVPSTMGDAADEEAALASLEIEAGQERILASLATRSPDAGNSRDGMSGEYAEGDLIADRYEVSQVLLGGMGVVYLCYDRQEGAPVALKSFQNRFLLNEKAVARFEQEALTWIRLEKHRHVVNAKLVQRFGSARPYILLEHISGPEGLGADLRSWIEQKRVTPVQSLSFGLHIALGMRHALERVPGLVHRDLKPANILVTHDHVAKVTDFGLVRSLDFEDITPMDMAMGRARTVDGRLTHMGAIIGTAPYLSPEQCRSNRVDARSDIYAFGCTMYEMLTGKFVFQARTLAAWLHAHLHEAPPLEYLQRAADGMPDGLIPLILGCLEKDPANRPQSWGEIADSVAGLIEQATGLPPVMEITGPALEASELMDKAYSLTELGHCDEALVAYDRALELDPENAWMWARKARTLRLLRRYDDALACCEQALAYNPRFAFAWKGRGIVLERMGRRDDALESFRSASLFDPYDAWNYYNQAGVLLAMGRFDDALVQLETALVMNENHVESLARRGQIYRMLQMYPEAAEAYEKAVALNPNFGWAQNGLGQTYRALGRLSDAITSFKRAVRTSSRETWYWYNLADALTEAGKYDEALAPAQEAVRLDPANSLAWAKLGQIFRYLKRYSEALVAYQKSLTIQPDHAWAQNGFGIVLERLEQYDDALEAYRRAAALSPNDPSYAYNMGNMLFLLSRYDEAAEVLSATVERHTGHANSWARLGNTYRVLNRLSDAERALQHAVTLQPENVWAWGELGSVYAAQGRDKDAREAFARAGQHEVQTAQELHTQAKKMLSSGMGDEAASVLQDALEQYPRNAALWALYGETLRTLGRLEEAVSALSQAQEIEPTSAQLRKALGQTLVALDRSNDALEAFREATRLAPNDAWAWFDLGNTLLAMDRTHEAIPPLEQSARLDDTQAILWSKLGQAYRKQERLPDALTAYDRALSLNPASAWSWNGRGLTLEAMGRREEALASYERALQEDASIPWNHNNLIDLLTNMNLIARAVEASDRAVETLPEEASIWSRRGLAYRRAGNLREAQNSYEQAIDLDNANGGAWNGLGMVHLVQNLYDEAASAFEMATRTAPHVAWYWRNLGDSLDMLQDYDAAAAAFEQALAIDPHHIATQRKLERMRSMLDD
ncbi:MAG: tetratricopeptide repeat protein [Pleurocapsa minor GSE-CHR-MK-17-07R]|jgi:tetratricopeptide (TPR) repeat protein/tRNA A-37 threonylcarbamoyl transferase component Bud32|nr:tetratricopeptide repeat protein [Pleurocapsa minor GSE-CHR-MK 17-07R]